MTYRNKHKDGFAILDLTVWSVLGATVLLIVVGSLVGISQLFVQSKNISSNIAEQTTLNQYVMADLTRGPGNVFLCEDRLEINGAIYTNRDGKIYRTYIGADRVLASGQLRYTAVSIDDQSYFELTLTEGEHRFEKTYKIVR